MEIIQKFSYRDLPPKLWGVAQDFYNMATQTIIHLPDCVEKEMAFNKLLESRDAAIKAARNIIK